MKLQFVTVAVACCALTAMPGLASSAWQQAQPDNTRVNQRDRSSTQPTADQAKNNKPDREIMKDIRKSVVDDKSLSSDAHNVKIIAHNGKVTLKGPVRSDDEKRAVRAKAEEVCGASNVTDEMSIRPKTKTE